MVFEVEITSLSRDETMKLDFVPLLQVQRDLYRIPRGRERFGEYLRMMLSDDRTNVQLPPLIIVNPMAKDHVPALLDALLALQAEDVAGQAVSEASEQLAGTPGEYKVALVLADDVMEGWTNRYTTEFSLRFELAPSLKSGWLIVVMWTSETPSPQVVREEVLTTIYRVAHLQQHGVAHTLQEMMAQEGFAMARAGCTSPVLDAEDISYTRKVITPHLKTQHGPTVMGCLFGDEVARALGYPPLGLRTRAGFALALHDARGIASKGKTA